ncbi:PREDICTED: uncharacterized protein LOC105555276 [Mandrillus leucophaeus]|uniref:uncharacterized protein LOC105555276 n=1 Tax=Mandrillus leucophaeus TaxID=9568 RepID=UPI0005F4BFAE|nr:PREDICTED: uncharacterized protein LOC105555276 [Mandrillus leucophaeus]
MGPLVLLLLQTAVLAFGVTYLLSRKRTVNRRSQIQTKKEMKPAKGCFCLFGGCPSQGFPGVPLSSSGLPPVPGLVPDLACFCPIPCFPIRCKASVQSGVFDLGATPYGSWGGTKTRHRASQLGLEPGNAGRPLDFSISIGATYEAHKEQDHTRAPGMASAE